ncbi:chemotaxis protein CheB [Haloferula sargassicola]|uniref:histidine kinase n=1 Tax=Haloferula sargassicola TaxID=490096 RepID=A0ABP9UTL6_9BACT
MSQPGSSSSSSQPSAPQAERFIVGIGASAGGLEALERFFEAVPQKPGLSFVVVQHLSPTYESHMEELLGRRTSLPIRRVTDGMPLEPDAIYLIPPAKNMIVSQGELLLTEKDGSALSYPIDAFFRSLASEAQKAAIAVILSGTGSDGTLGAESIHDAGGLVLAQDEHSAKFDGMPSSAVEAGIVDLVMAPEKMPEVIARYASDDFDRGELVDRLPPEIPDTALELIFSRLRERYGIDFSQYKPNTISRRIQRRIGINDDLDLETYANRISDDPGEVDALYRDLLIGVTRFFRDAAAFESLMEKGIRPLVAREAEEIRIWVPGCASGEEAYSIAILVHEECERQNKPFRLKLFASDVHADSVRQAGEGVFPAESLGDMSRRRMQRYFIQREGGYQIVAELRQAIVFTQHNLMKDVPFTRLHLISCRNLLIYLQPNAQKRIFSYFHFGLRTGGMLLLGPSETIGDLEEEFSVLDKHWKLYKKRRDVRLVKEHQQPAFVQTAAVFRQPGDTPAREEGWDRPRREHELLRIYDNLLNHYMPAGILVDDRQRVVHVFEGAERFLRIARGRASQSLADLIRDELKASVSGALQHATKDQRPVRYTGIRLDGKSVDIKVTPFSDPQSASTTFFVSFEEPAAEGDGAEARVESGRVMAQDDRRELEMELRYTKENLQATIEELETSNEELQATNEELIASNEELQSSNEELHSVNEELDTVNREYQNKIRQLTEMTDDLDNVLSATEIGVIFLNPDLTIRKFTPRIRETFRFMRRDLGCDITGFAHPLRYDGLREDLLEVLASKKALTRDVRADDSRIYLLRVGAYESDRAQGGLILSIVDITAITEAEGRARRLAETFQAAVRNFPEMLLVINRNKQVEFISPDADAFMRRYAAPGALPLGLDADVDDALRHNRSHLPVDFNGVRELTLDDGTRRAYLSRVTVFEDSTGVPAGAVVTIQDVTEFRMLDELKTDLISTLSHELKNPLTGITFSLGILLEDSAGQLEETQRKLIESAQNEAQRIQKMISSMLELGRFEGGAGRSALEDVEVSKLLAEAEENHHHAASVAGIELVTEVAEGCDTIRCNPRQTIVVLDNLISNAIKHSPRGTTVTLRAGNHGEGTRFSVTDQGPGFDPQYGDQVFTKFFRIPGNDLHGNGIGLSIARQFVLAQGGTIGVDTEPGKGASFHFTLP